MKNQKSSKLIENPFELVQTTVHNKCAKLLPCKYIIGLFGQSWFLCGFMNLVSVSRIWLFVLEVIRTSKTQKSHDFINLVNNVLCTNHKIETVYLPTNTVVINSAEFKQFLKEKQLKLIFTAVNSAFSNGLNERLNPAIMNRIRCKINEEKEKN